MNNIKKVLRGLIQQINNSLKKTPQNLTKDEKAQVKDNLDIYNPDWSENDPSSSKYVEGRTHWAETEEATIYEGTPEFTLFSGELMDNREVFRYDAYDYPLPDQFQSSPGIRPDAVTITVNDVSYNVLICPHYTVLDQFKCKIENGYIAITTNYIGYNALNIYVTEELTNIPLKITCNITTYTCLDEKYIPDRIARTNDYLPINTKKTLTQTQVQNARANIKLDTPDWGETNSALPSYIKNKTHGYSRATYTAFNSKVSSGALDGSGYVTITAVLRLPYYNNAAKGVFTRCGSFQYNNITTDFTLDTQFLHGDMSVRINSSTVQYNGAYYFITASIIMEVEEAFVDKNIRVNLYYDELLTLDDKYISSNIARIEDTVVPVTISTSSSSYAWTASTSAISSYSNGLVILGKIPNISYGPSITLKINSLAAYTIYTGAGTLTNQIPVGTYILLRCNTTTQRWEVINYIDTKNTVGNSITSSRLTLVGVTSNSNQPDSSIKSYVRPTCYIDTDGCLYSNGVKVSTVDDLDVINTKLPYIIEGTYDHANGAYTITSYDTEKVLNSYNNGGTIVLHIATADDSSVIFRYMLDYICINSDDGSQTLSFIRVDESATVYYLNLYNGEVDESFSTHAVSEQQLQNILKNHAYVITGNCTVVDSSIECSLDTTPDIKKIRDCMSTGKPCYLYLEDSYDGQYRIFTPVMDYNADGRIRFQHPDGNTIYILDLDADDPTNIPGHTSELITTNSVYSRDKYDYPDITENHSDYLIPTNATVADTIRNLTRIHYVTTNEDGTYVGPSFSILSDYASRGISVLLRFTDCAGQVVNVPQIAPQSVVDGTSQRNFALVYPGFTEETWKNTYRVFISINSKNETTVRHDVISNATIPAISAISEKLEA